LMATRSIFISNSMIFTRGFVTKTIELPEIHYCHLQSSMASTTHVNLKR
jgi:hypothetical protein